MGLMVAVILLTVVALGIGLIAPVVFEVIAADNTTKTEEDLEALKVAVAGNPRLIISSGRADFGFIGTIGNVPAQLSQLWIGSGLPAYSFDTDNKVGAGWVGPYIPSGFVEDLLSLDKDRFGNAFTYVSTPFTRTSDSQVVAARIQSAGADGVAGTSDDLYQDILSSEIYSTVTGTLYKGNNPVPYATVTLNIPSNGTVSQQTDVTDSSGVFSFSNVTFGFRSVSIDPKLTYEPGTAKTQNGGRTVQFKLTNYATSDVTITSLTATYNRTAWYEVIRIGNTNVWTWTTSRAASGQTITFAGQTVEGSGKPTQVVPIRVDKENTVTPDLFIRGVGRTVTIELQNFKDKIDDVGGAAGNVTMGGTTFTIGMSDGSSNTFTVP